MAMTRRTFTPEFKAEAAKLVTEQGPSFIEVAATSTSPRARCGAGGGDRQRGAQALPPGQPARPREELRRLRARSSGSRWSARS